MSATIYYQPVKGKALSIGAPSSFTSALDRAFGRSPDRILNEYDVPTLRGIAAGFDSEDQRAAIDELIEAIQKHAAVRLWAEY